MKKKQQTEPTNTALLVGIDWADSKHDIQIKLLDGSTRSLQIDADPQSLETLVTDFQTLANDQPIAICIEKSRVALVYHLMLRVNIRLYLVDPKQLARYRESFTSGGAKDDLRDSGLLLRLLAERQDELKVFEPDDELTRLIGQLSHARRALVDDRTRLSQQLQNKLKTYHPLLLMLVGGNAQSRLLMEALKRWPDPRAFRRLQPKTLRAFLKQHRIKDPEKADALIDAIRKTPLVTRDEALIKPMAIVCRSLVKQIEQLDKAIQELQQAAREAMAQHPDATLFTSLPGAGEALAPRLLAAFGSRRDRYQNADEIGTYSGILPVTKQSGKTKHVSRPRACPKFLRQTFHEFAAAAKQWCDWSRAYYQWLRTDKKTGHHAALRKLASRWIRILFKVWKSKTQYQPEIYINALKTKHHPCIKFLKITN